MEELKRQSQENRKRRLKKSRRTRTVIKVAQNEDRHNHVVKVPDQSGKQNYC